MTKGISINNLSKSYANHRILNDLSLELEPQKLIAIGGSNGSGKTTLLNLLAGLSQPDSGTIKYYQTAAPSADIGYCAHESLLYENLTICENLKLVCALANSKSDLSDHLELWGLNSRQDQLVRSLSRGLVQRASIARATVLSPRYLLLDEPTSHLDNDGVSSLCKYLLNFRGDIGKDRVIIVATHDPRILEIADQLLRLNFGKLGTVGYGTVGLGTVGLGTVGFSTVEGVRPSDQDLTGTKL